MEGGNPYVMAIIAQIGVGITAVCSLLAVIIQVRGAGKQKKQDYLVKTIDGKLDVMKSASEERAKALWDSITEHQLRYFKDELVGTLSRIENGYKPTTEEKHILHEQKARYNELGGDSYVDEMWDKLIKKELI